MYFSRRQFALSLSAFSLAACGAPSSRGQIASQTGLPPEFRPVRNPAFLNWIDAFRPRARAAGLSDRTLDIAFQGVGFIPGVVERDRNQIESRRTFEDYLSIATSDERLAKGRRALAQNRGLLAAIEDRYGVDALVVTAIWGLESLYGERKGQIPVISATATLAYDGRRGSFYEKQLVAALRIVERGDIPASRMVGSWAGAMGHTQFIPTSYQAFAVDFDGDGRRDIWSDNPGDALASTASYLARNGWRKGLKWGAEAGTGGPAGRTITPQPGGVAFTVTRNFNALKTYNNSDFYAIGVGHLADRLGGGGPLRGRFPPDANGLTKSDRIALQRALKARGYDIGTVDGVIGKKTEAAVADFQRAQGLAVTGRATPDVLAQLQ